MPDHYLKHVVDGIYEIRVRFGSNTYRTFCFFKAHKLVILANSIQKKLQNLPKREIQRTIAIRKDYHREIEYYEFRRAKNKILWRARI